MVDRQPAQCALSFQTLGGLHNQKECVVNAIIAAHSLGIPLQLPTLRLVGEGNEQFAPQHAKYRRPFNARLRDGTPGGRFDLLFNTTHARALLRSASVGVAHRRPAERLLLPSLCIMSNGSSSSCAHSLARTYPTAANSTLSRLLNRWQPIVSASCRARKGNTPLVLDAQHLLCWSAYQSRHTQRCVAQHPVCAQALRAFRWSDSVSKLQAQVVAGVEALARAGSGPPSSTSWAALHIRGYVCAQRGRTPSLGHVASSLKGLGMPTGFLYLVSGVAAADIASSLPEYSCDLPATSILHPGPLQPCKPATMDPCDPAPLHLAHAPCYDRHHTLLARGTSRQVKSACARAPPPPRYTIAETE